MSPRCGTDIEFEEFHSGGEIVAPERVLPSLPSIGGLEVPNVATREALVADLRGRTADEIFSILANSLAESRYGSAESVLRNVAFDLEDAFPELAYGIHLKNWENLRDSGSLGRLVELAVRIGKGSEGFKYARIARFLGEGIDPFLLVGGASFEGGAVFVESVLSQAIVENPIRVRYLTDSETARFLSESRAYDDERLAGLNPDSKEAWEIRLHGLEYRWLTLLDPVAANTLVRLLTSLVDGTAEFSGDRKTFVSEYAVSSPSMVAESYYAIANDGDPVIAEDRTPVSEMIRRRFFHVSEHFRDHRFMGLHENLKNLHTALDNPQAIYCERSVIAELLKERAFYESLPASVTSFRNGLLGEISDEFGSAFYPRSRCRVFGLSKKPVFKNHGVGALLLVDMLAREEEPTDATHAFATKLWEYPVIPEVASMVAFAFAARSQYYQAAEWLSRSNLDDVENSALLLRIVADFRELSDIAIDAFRKGAPAMRSSSELALAKVRASVSKFPEALSNEMMGDAESAFGNPEKAVELYRSAYSAGNVPALKKAADLCYAMGRFSEARADYEFIHFCGWFPEVGARLCLFACECGDIETATKYFPDVDVADPENAETIAHFHALKGNLFTGLSLLSNFPPAVSADLFQPLRETYASYADSLLSGISVNGAISAVPESERIPSVLLALRMKSVIQRNGVADATRYFRFLRDLLRLSENTDSEAEIDAVLIGLLAPCHDPSALGFAKSEDGELRTETVLNLLIQEAHSFSRTHQESLSGHTEARMEYSSMLLVISDVFAHFGEDLAGFFRNAGADATVGKSPSAEMVRKASQITFH